MESNGNKVAVVVGGTSGLGLAVATTFTANGFNVIIGARDQGKLTKAAETIGGQTKGLLVDVTNQVAVEKFFEQIGTFDHLVLTASAGFADRSLVETSLEEIKEFTDTKLWGALRCVKIGHKDITTGGSITFVSGAVSRKGRAGAHAKTITNNALEGLTRSLAAEFGSRIRVNCISPGMFDSKGTMTPTKREEIGLLYPLRYVGNSNEVAAVIYTVATNHFMTGSVIFVDGGWTAV